MQGVYFQLNFKSTKDENFVFVKVFVFQNVGISWLIWSYKQAVYEWYQYFLSLVDNGPKCGINIFPRLFGVTFNTYMHQK